MIVQFRKRRAGATSGRIPSSPLRLRARPKACDVSLREFCARERIVAPAEIGSFERRPFAGCAIKRNTTFEYRVIEGHIAIEDRSAKPRLVGEVGGVKARAGAYGHSFKSKALAEPGLPEARVLADPSP